MTIYVDPLFQAGIEKNEAARQVGERHNHQWCHLYAYPVTIANLEELHDLAWRIGLKRSWFQAKGSLPHYDLVPTKRSLAVANGAQEISTYGMLKHLKEHRSTLKAAREATTDERLSNKPD